MKRAIKAHKGGRTIKKSLDVTPDTASTLASLPISLGDLVEVAAKDMKMNQEQLNTLIGKQYPFQVWNDELKQEVGEYMEVGSAELSIRQPSGKPYARLAAVGVTWEMGKAGTAYIPLEQALKAANIHTVRKTVTTRVGWREIPEQYRNDEGAVFYAKREWDGTGNVKWEQYAYFADDYWCLDGVIEDEPSYA